MRELLRGLRGGSGERGLKFEKFCWNDLELYGSGFLDTMVLGFLPLRSNVDPAV